MTYRVVTYNGNTRHVAKSLFAYELKDAVDLLKTRCNDIIDDFAHDGIRVSVLRPYMSDSIRIDGIDGSFNNYYVVFLIEESYDYLDKNEG